jgi:demethylmenaquinone methyltransferase/2-methoxy-6-polyprenyl-1,4-benzoquinol methylase
MQASAACAAWQAQGRAIRDLFAPLAARYDLQNRLFSLGLDMGWRRALVDGIGTENAPPALLLDLAAGTLDVSRLLHRRFPKARVLAFDLCAPMLRRGLARKFPAGAPVSTRTGPVPAVADARALPLQDACADHVTVAFGIRNMVPRAAALAEIARVLKSGGGLHVLEFAPVRLPLIGPLYRWHLTRLMPVLAELVSGEGAAFRYLGASVDAFPDPGAFARELAAAGLRPTAWRQLALGIANIHRAVKAQGGGYA